MRITLVFFLEEPSARAFLEGLLPRFLPMEKVDIRYVVFEGKEDLERQLVHRMRYWQAPNSHFILLRDQDSANCKHVKERLMDLCKQASHPKALVRIACHEIESWYLGDLAAVEQALNLTGVARKQEKRKFRDPDRLANACEEMLKLTGHLYQKIGGSRAIGQVLDPAQPNRSPSFRVFVDGVRRVVETALAEAP